MLVCTGGSEKSNGEVEVGMTGAGEKPVEGVEADSVASRSMVGSGAETVSLPNPLTRTTMKTKKPQNKTSPAAIQRVRLFLIMCQ